MPIVEFPKYIWMDGEFVDWNNAKIHVTSQAVLYGLSVFEGIRFYKSIDDETNIFRLNSHLDRLYQSANIYQIEIPLKKDIIIKACKEIIKKNDIGEGHIRIVVYRGHFSDRVAFGLKVRPPVGCFMIALPLKRYLGSEALEKGIRCNISSWERINPRSLPSHAKMVGNYLNSSLARMEAVDNGFDEAIFLDHRGFISEGTGENIFCIKNGLILTPPLHASILDGITRDTVITICKESKYKIFERDITRAQLYSMDEVFLCGSASEITPVTEIDHRTIGTGKMGTMTKDIQKKYFDVVTGKVKNFNDWLITVS